MDLPITLPQLTGSHTGKKIAEIVSKTLQQFGINSRTVGYFMLDNATNNDAAVLRIAEQMGLTAAHCRESHKLKTLLLRLRRAARRQQ
jgi:hypothetical protein